MCGIVGYTGTRQAMPILLEGLQRLEYRGYDSAGVAVCSGGKIEIVKAVGRLQALRQLIGDGCKLPGTCGIGHTRWATHGAPGAENAHPHFSDDRSVVLVHNGIIENHSELRSELLQAGYVFYGDTDTETIAKLIHCCRERHRCGPMEALALSLKRLQGSYALAVVFADCPEEILAVRKDSPLIIGGEADGACLASDVQALLPRTRSVYYMENLEIARLRKDGVDFFDSDLQPVSKAPAEIPWKSWTAGQDGYEHFMLKEICEQPQAVQDTVDSLVRNGRIDLSAAGLEDDCLRGCGELCILGCGSAYHAGLVIRHAVEELAGIPARVELASEFRCRKALLGKDCLAMVISQSGETADSLAALREAKAQGMRTLAIVNVPGSGIAREADHVLLTQAGPEIAVATTKAYSAQLAAGYLLAMRLALARGRINPQFCAAMTGELRSIPEKIRHILWERERIRELAAGISAARDAFFTGRGLDCAVAMEGSLKLKEVSYIHAEAYAAGELKHGAISLIEDQMPVVAVLTRPELRAKMITGMAECRSRGARLLCVTSCSDEGIAAASDAVLQIPETYPCFCASLAVVPLQLLSYYVGLMRGLDVDKPRNLAKSVTVE